MQWTIETLNAVVDKELNDLPADMRARFVRISELIEAVGLERVGAPHIKHVTGLLWEMRMKGRDVRHGSAETGRRRACVCEKDHENTAARD